MLLASVSITALNPHSGIGLILLIFGAMFTAAVGVSVASFYLDDYWEDEEFREELRHGSNRNEQSRRQQKV